MISRVKGDTMAEEDKLQHNVEIIDTSRGLTLDELRELKKLASLSKATKYIVGAVMGVVGITGLPTLLEWFNHIVQAKQ